MSPSPERLYLSEPFDFSDQNVVKHVSRYTFASNFAYGEILDCACGSGYGSVILSDRGDVIGIDQSSDAIDYAEIFNPGPTYGLMDVCSMTVNSQFDSIVCIETFEHIEAEKSYQLLVKFDSLLKPDGVLFLTTPMLRYKDGKPYVTNPYHVNEMGREKLSNLFNDVFGRYTKTYFHQEVDRFTPLKDEHTGFMIMVARKP